MCPSPLPCSAACSTLLKFAKRTFVHDTPPIKSSRPFSYIPLRGLVKKTIIVTKPLLCVRHTQPPSEAFLYIKVGKKFKTRLTSRKKNHFSSSLQLLSR